MSIVAPVSSWMARIVLAAGADQQADLLRIDLRLKQPWGSSAEISARGRRIAVSIVLQQFVAGLSGLFERVANDLFADAVDLQIELNPGDPLPVPATLKSMSPKWSSSPMMSVSSV